MFMECNFTSKQCKKNQIEWLMMANRSILAASCEHGRPILLVLRHQVAGRNCPVWSRPYCFPIALAQLCRGSRSSRGTCGCFRGRLHTSPAQPLRSLRPAWCGLRTSSHCSWTPRGCWCCPAGPSRSTGCRPPTRGPTSAPPTTPTRTGSALRGTSLSACPTVRGPRFSLHVRSSRKHICLGLRWFMFSWSPTAWQMRDVGIIMLTLLASWFILQHSYRPIPQSHWLRSGNKMLETCRALRFLGCRWPLKCVFQISVATDLQRGDEWCLRKRAELVAVLNGACVMLRISPWKSRLDWGEKAYLSEGTGDAICRQAVWLEMQGWHGVITSYCAGFSARHSCVVQMHTSLVFAFNQSVHAGGSEWASPKH